MRKKDGNDEEKKRYSSWLGSYKQQVLTNDPKTTFIHAGFASVCSSICDSHIEHQFLKRPTVGLCDALACCGYIGFRIQQATQPNMKCLKSKIRLSWMLHVTRELQRQTLTSRTFSSLAPPCETSSDTSCSCFTR